MNSVQPTLRPASWTPAIRMGLSIATATGLYGVSFGALAVAAGLSVGQAMALSLLQQMPVKKPLLDRVLSGILADPGHPFYNQAKALEAKI